MGVDRRWGRLSMPVRAACDSQDAYTAQYYRLKNIISLRFVEKTADSSSAPNPGQKKRAVDRVSGKRRKNRGRDRRRAEAITLKH